MARLPRPHIPLRVRIEVAERQLRETAGHFPKATGGLIAALTLLRTGERLTALLDILKDRLGATALELHHDPALGARVKILGPAGEIAGYRPDANDPRFLVYLEEHAHLIRTNVRGEHGQHPDRVLIKKQRRRERPRPKRFAKAWPKGRPIPKRPFRRKP